MPECCFYFVLFAPMTTADENHYGILVHLINISLLSRLILEIYRLSLKQYNPSLSFLELIKCLGIKVLSESRFIYTKLMSII